MPNTRSRSDEAAASGSQSAPRIEHPASSADQQPSSLIQATAVHMQLTANIHDQMAELRSLTDTITKHLITKDLQFKHDVSKFTSKITICCGTEPEKLVQFMEEVQSLVDLKIAPDVTLLSAALDRLQGELLFWWPEAVSKYQSWPNIKKELLKKFVPPTIKIQLVNSLARRHQRSNETFSEFIRDIRCKADLLEAGLSQDELICHIWAYANVTTLADLKHSTMPSTLDELAKLSQRMEESEMLIKLAKQRDVKDSSDASSPTKIQCAYCKQVGHLLKDCIRRQRANARNDQPSPKN